MKWAEPHLANRRELLEAVKSGRFFYRQKVTSKRKGRIVVGKGAFGRRQGSYQAGYLTVVISKVQVGLATFLGGTGFPFSLSWAVLGCPGGHVPPPGPVSLSLFFGQCSQ